MAEREGAKITYIQRDGSQKTYRLKPYEKVKSEVEKHITKERLASPYSLKDFRDNGNLFHNLRTLALVEYGTQSPGLILAKMGFEVRRQLPFDEVRTIFAKAITPQIMAEVYLGKENRTIQKLLEENQGRLGKQAFFALYNKRRGDYSPKGLEELINTLHPQFSDLEEEFGYSPYRALYGFGKDMNDEEIGEIGRAHV